MIRVQPGMLASFEPEAEAEVPTVDMTSGYGVSIGGDEGRRIIAAGGRKVEAKAPFGGRGRTLSHMPRSEVDLKIIGVGWSNRSQKMRIAGKGISAAPSEASLPWSSFG